MASNPPIPLTLETRLRPTPSCAHQIVGAQAIAIVPHRRRQHFFANDVAADIWRGITAEKSLSEIRDDLVMIYEIAREEVERDLLEACRKLVAEEVAEPVRD